MPVDNLSDALIQYNPPMKKTMQANQADKNHLIKNMNSFVTSLWQRKKLMRPKCKIVYMHQTMTQNVCFNVAQIRHKLTRMSIIMHLNYYKISAMLDAW